MRIFDENNENRKLFLPAIHTALIATCQLYHNTTTKNYFPTANGCCVLFEHNSHYYCLSNAHVIADEQLGKTFILLNDGTTMTLGGQIFHTRLPESQKRNDDTLDIAVVKLAPEIANHLKKSGYTFINSHSIKTGITLPEKQQILLAGFPASKTKLDSTTRQLKFQPLAARTIPYEKKEELKNYPKALHHILEFPRKSFRETSTKERMIAPKLEGMSGSGIWMLATHDYVTIFPLLIGIFCEFHRNKSIIISTKIDLFMDLIKQKFDPTIPNDGVELELLGE